MTRGNSPVIKTLEDPEQQHHPEKPRGTIRHRSFLGSPEGTRSRGIIRPPFRAWAGWRFFSAGLGLKVQECAIVWHVLAFALKL
jgi:hypothetical protein